MRYSSLIRICLVFSFAAVVLSAQTPTFSAPKAMPSSIPAGDTAFVGLAGNFNGNGNTDLIAGVGPAFYGPFTPEFLAGDGTGKFTQTGTVTSLPATYNQILVADVNGDGKDDIITLMGGCEELPCNNWPDEGNGDGVFTVLLSQGNGKFIQSDLDTLPSGLAGVQGVIGDFNKDGKPDVAVLSYSGTGENTTELTIFLNQGNGTFTQTVYQTPAVLSTGIGTTNLVVGDFEGNGNLDLAFGFISTNFGSTLSPVQIMAFAGDGKGNFGPGVIAYTLNNYIFQVNQTSLFATDLNGDGRTDLAINLQLEKGTGFVFATLLANTSGKFSWGSAVNYGTFYNSVAFADVNGDGHPDFIFVSSTTNSSGTSTTDYGGIYLGTASGGFHTPHIALSVPGNGNEPGIITAPLKTGALPSLFVSGAKSVGLEFINTTK
jgi:FG-GAP-like repeat